jgi:hypothetical protein
VSGRPIDFALSNTWLVREHVERAAEATRQGKPKDMRANLLLARASLTEAINALGEPGKPRADRPSGGGPKRRAAVWARR